MAGAGGSRTPRIPAPLHLPAPLCKSWRLRIISFIPFPRKHDSARAVTHPLNNAGCQRMISITSVELLHAGTGGRAGLRPGAGWREGVLCSGSGCCTRRHHRVPRPEPRRERSGGEEWRAAVGMPVVLQGAGLLALGHGRAAPCWLVAPKGRGQLNSQLLVVHNKLRHWGCCSSSPNNAPSCASL